MPIVRFATVCDHEGCTRRSAEYTTHYQCTECGRYFCEVHTLNPREDEGRKWCKCYQCYWDEQGEVVS